MMSLRILVGGALALLTSLAHAQANGTDCAPMVEGIGMPEIGGGHDHVVLCRTGHLLAHSDVWKTPVWVVERLAPERFAGDATRDKLCKFVPDPDLTTGAVTADYKAKSKRGKRSFDRGHMAPAADMKWDEAAMRESCLLSNIAPQHGINLNRHIWADLEALVRDWTCDRKELYVVTGPIYDTDEPDTLGDGVAVPTAFYKVAYEPRQRRAIAFILPNEPVKKNGQESYDLLVDFIVKPSEVERRAGIRLFTALPSRDRNRVRSHAAVMWNVFNGCSAK